MIHMFFFLSLKSFMMAIYGLTLTSCFCLLASAFSFSIPCRELNSRRPASLHFDSTHANCRHSPLAVASVTDDELIESTYEDDEKNEQELIAEFVDMVLHKTPRGEMGEDDAHLLREIMADFPTNIDELEPASTVEALLSRLLDEWEDALQTEDTMREEIFRPTADDFFIVISTWEKSEDGDKVVKVLSLLSDQRELFTNNLTSVQPDLATIKSILRTLASSRERGLDRRAAMVFQSLPDYGLYADVDTYELMISITAKSRATGAAQRAEKLLREGVETYPPQLIGKKVDGISSDTFNTVVTAYAKSGDEQGPEKAEQLIMFMDQIDTEHGSLGVCNPTISTFTSLIDAYAQRNEWEAAHQADRILNQLLDQYMEGNDDLEPNIATWTIVISAWARLSKKNRRGAEERAGRLLKRMEDLHEAGRINCKPDAIAYVTCMNAYAFAKSGNGAEEAERILDEMNEFYLDGDDTMKPSAKSIKIIVEAWVKSGDMERAEDLLDKYEDFLVSSDNPRAEEDIRDLYKSILFGYTQHDDPSRARDYLELMLEQGLKPDSFCFDRIIDVNTRLGPVENLKSSLEIFELMEKSFRAGDVEPNERVYTSFIRALTKGKTSAMHKKAEILLQRMKKLNEAGNRNLKPTVFTYNAVLFACSESIGLKDSSSSDVFKTAVRIFTELKNSNELNADHVTYGNMIRCGRLLPDGEQKDKFVSATFHLAAEQGYLNNFVIRDLQETVAESLWRELLNLPSGPAEMEYLNPDWSYMIDHKGGSKTFKKHKGGSKTFNNSKNSYRSRG